MNTSGMNNLIDGQVFNTREELIDWVQSVGRSLGYVIVIKRSKCNTNVLFQCNRGGTYKSTCTVRKRGSIKVDCGFAVEGIYMSGDNCWILKILNLAHNHEPAEFLEGHAYARRFNENEIEVVKELSVNNVKPRNILSTIKKQFPENVSTLKSIYNARQKFRLTEKDGKTQMQVLMSFLHEECYVFYTRASTSTTELEDLFFAHPTSLAIWCAFPHVLLIDATYKINRYGLPLLEIVGVSSTNMTFSIAFVLMDKEKEPNYVWALECLKATMDECMSPRVIVTDRELALINAYRLVFPKAKGLLCRFHIFRNITKHCRQSFASASHWYAFQNVWGKVVQSPTWELYLNNLAQLQSILVDHHGVITYIDKAWLTPYKEMFVSVWTDKFLNFGNHTTNRAESQHAKLKKYLESSQSDLVTTLHRIHDVVQSQDTAIKASLEQSKILIQNQFNIPHFQQLLNFVSIYALELMLSEYKRSDTVGVFIEECGCHLRSSHGLPCAHEQAEYKSALQPVHDVRGDGNCGFRAVAVCMGRNQDEWPQVRSNLIEELRKHWFAYVILFGEAESHELYNRLNFFDLSRPAPLAHWMNFPEVGILIVNRYNVPLHVLGENGGYTYFPLWTPPPANSTPNPIAITFVDNNHYVCVQLAGEYPVPSVVQSWFHYRNECATEWIAPYVERIATYNQQLSQTKNVGYEDIPSDD